MGAIAEDGTAVLNSDARTPRGHDARRCSDAHRARGRASCAAGSSATATGGRRLDVRGRTVIVVDDGLATGLTDLAAVRALRARGATRIVVAVPVGAREAVAMVGEEADEIVCHTIPHELLGVGRWYQDFSPVSDAEVRRAAGAAGCTRPGGRDRRSHPPAATSPPIPPAATSRPSRRAISARELTLDIGGVSLRGDLTHPAGRARAGDLRARQRLEPPEPAQPRGRRDAQRGRSSRRCCSTCSTEREEQHVASSSSTFRCSRADSSA